MLTHLRKALITRFLKFAAAVASLERLCTRRVAPADAPAFAPRASASGSTRADWLDCAHHVLSGAFSHVPDSGTPMLLPKLSDRAYPWFGNRLSGRRRRAEAGFEALVRTFNLAAPLIAADSRAETRGILLSEYYRRHLVAALTDRESAAFVGDPSADKPRQPTVELGNLALWCLLQPRAFWALLSPAEKDAVAAAMRRWAEARTCDTNWRWFNATALSFLDSQGYAIDRNALNRHLDRLLEMSVADGWYRDVGFDYYTAHVFHLYAAVWCRHYGRERDAARAAQFERHLSDYAKSGSMLFSRDGRVNMYGRSIAYRQAATVGLIAPFLADIPTATRPGEARRICTAAMLQFVSRGDCFRQGIPTLGFYGPFEPAVQHYSCSASPYWMFVGMTALTLPADHPFWTAPEEPGAAWESLSSEDVRSEFLQGPGLLLTNHGTSGAAEIRPSAGRHAEHADEPSYARHVYSTAFPWEADASPGATAGTLSLSDGAVPCRTTLVRHADGVLYRRAHYRTGETVDFATILIPGGEIRVDRFRPKGLRLGHFGLPHLGAPANVTRKTLGRCQAITAAIPGRSLALVAVAGWTDAAAATHRGLHPEAEESTVVYLESSSSGHDFLVAALLHRCDDDVWRDEDLQPVASFTSGADVRDLRLELKTGQVIMIRFSGAADL